MGKAVIKKDKLDLVIGYGKSGAALKDREDHDDLALIARESGDQSLIDLFEELPSLSELKRAKADAGLSASSEFGPTNPTLTNMIPAEPLSGGDSQADNKNTKANKEK